MGINPREFYGDWSAREFYHLARYLIWESHCQKNYQEIIAARHKPK